MTFAAIGFCSLRPLKLISVSGQTKFKTYVKDRALFFTVTETKRLRTQLWVKESIVRRLSIINIQAVREDLRMLSKQAMEMMRSVYSQPNPPRPPLNITAKTDPELKF